MVSRSLEEGNETGGDKEKATEGHGAGAALGDSGGLGWLGRRSRDVAALVVGDGRDREDSVLAGALGVDDGAVVSRRRRRANAGGLVLDLSGDDRGRSVLLFLH